MPVIRSSIRSQRGSITVLIAMLIPVLLLTIILIVNLGQLVFEKIRLQHGADTAVMAAGTVQAMGMNELAHLNYHARNEYIKMLIILKKYPHIWHNRFEGLKVISFYRDRVLGTIDLYRKWVNSTFPARADAAAKWVTLLNQPPNRIWKAKTTHEPEGRLINYAVETRSAGFYYVSAWSPKSLTWILTKKWNDFAAGDPTRVGPHDGSYISTQGVVSIGYTMRNLSVRWRKVNELTRYTMYLSQEPTPYVLGSNFFGNMPKLSVIGKVRPTNGHIFEMIANYQTSLNVP